MMEDRIKKLEKQVERLQRRAVKVSTGLITPYPISGHMKGTDIKGEVLSFMFPCEGMISKGLIKFGIKPKGNPAVSIKFSNELTSEDKGFVCDKILNVVDLHISAKAGDCLTVTIIPDVEHPVANVWVTLLWKPTIKDVEAMSFLIDKLEEVGNL